MKNKPGDKPPALAPPTRQECEDLAHRVEILTRGLMEIAIGANSLSDACELANLALLRAAPTLEAIGEISEALDRRADTRSPM